MAVHDPILSLRLIIHRRAMGVVIAQPHARGDEDAIDLVAHEGNRRPVGNREGVEPAHDHGDAGGTAGRLGEVVAVAGLVVKGGDPAISVGAEGVLRGRVGVAAGVRRGGLDDADVQGLAVGLAHYLVERAVVGGVQRACGAVGGHAGGAAGGVDVTRALRSERLIIAPTPAWATIFMVATAARAPARALSKDRFVFSCLACSFNQDFPAGSPPGSVPDNEAGDQGAG